MVCLCVLYVLGAIFQVSAVIYAGAELHRRAGLSARSRDWKTRVLTWGGETYADDPDAPPPSDPLTPKQLTTNSRLHRRDTAIYHKVVDLHTELIKEVLEIRPRDWFAFAIGLAGVVMTTIAGYPDWT